jgi:hypothetical protein
VCVCVGRGGYIYSSALPELNPSAQRCLTRFFYCGFCFSNRAFRYYTRMRSLMYKLKKLFTSKFVGPRALVLQKNYLPGRGLTKVGKHCSKRAFFTLPRPT